LRFINAFFTLLQRRGLSYLGYLITGVFVPKVAYRLIFTSNLRHIRKVMEIISAIIIILINFLLIGLVGCLISLGITFSLGLLVFLGFHFFHKSEIHHLNRMAHDLTCEQQEKIIENQFTRWQYLQVPADTRRAVNAAMAAHSQDDLFIGQIDQDGRVLGVYGSIPGMDMVSSENFLSRKRYKLDIILCDGYVLLRKNFGADHAGFVREWCHLLIMAGKANVPAVYKVDKLNHLLYMNFIPGRTVRDVLVEAGAKIRDGQVLNAPELAMLDPTKRASQVIDRGRTLIAGCLDETFLVKLEEQLNRIHACKIASLDVKYGNVIIHPDDGSPWLVDFENARWYQDSSRFDFLYKRDRDRQRFNYLFHRNLLTEVSARDLLEKQGRKMPWYAPLDFGNGLTVGPFWSTDAGTGRWEYLNKRVLVPTVKGKRVLDLGSNNGTMPIMMLRSGAKEVIGLELSPIEIERAVLIRQIFEWTDIRAYDLTIHNLNMLEVLHRDWGRFDLVTAFCSLYYLDVEQMERVVCRAAEIAPIMVVQANVSNQQDSQKQIKASIPFLKKLLEKNGFPDVKVFAPKKYARPLLIGRASP
jgi:SAM-dependent methyltransferase